jgi:acetolactate synthase-1/2/3 large subunit
VVPPYRPRADEASIAEAVSLLERAARPVIVSGGGVRASGAGNELVRVAEMLGIPIVTSANGRDTVPGDHPLNLGVVGTYSRESANRAVARADLVCFVGTTAGGMTTHFWRVPQLGTRAIQIDTDPETIGRNYPVEVGVLGDARTTLARMAELADPGSARIRETWRAEVEALRAEWRDRYESAMTSDEAPIRPERLCRELSAALPSDGIVAVDTGHAGMWMSQFFDLSSPTQSYLRSAGHLGWAFPAGLGAKCAQPDRPTFVFTGDAGFYYHLAELETAVRWNINTIVVVNNNLGGTQSRAGWQRMYGDRPKPPSNELWTYADVDLAAIASNFGALGIRVDKPSNLSSAFAQAVEANRPVVIDARTAVDADAPSPVTL